jgi:S-formylglutathione hydrolase FrmB
MVASRPHWSTITVAGRECELFAPPAPAAGRAVVWLHDLAEERLCDAAPFRDPLEAARVPVIAPRSGRSWWLDRPMPGYDAGMTPERFVVDAVRAEIERRFAVRPPGIAVMGVGMGGQGALRIAYRHPAVFPVAAAVAPAIDFHRGMREAGDLADGELFDTLWEAFGDVERARQDTAILHVHPLNWPRHQYFASDPADALWHDGADRLRSKLVALGIPHVAALEPRADFAAAAAAAAVAFVLAALDAEGRRLPNA